MAERNPPSWLQNGSHPAEQDRQLLMALLGGSLNQTPQTGIVGVNDFVVTATGTPDMNTHIAAGSAFILGSENVNQGVYGVYNDASVTKLHANSDPTNPRIDLIVLQVLDGIYSGVSNLFQIFVVTGTPAASPAVPALPKNSIAIAQVRVNAAVSSITSGNITDVRSRIKGGNLYSSPGIASSGFTNIVINQVVVPAQPGPYILIATFNALLTFTVAADAWDIALQDGGVAQSAGRIAIPASAGTLTPPLSYMAIDLAGATRTINVNVARNTGTGTATCFSDGTHNQLYVAVIQI